MRAPIVAAAVLAGVLAAGCNTPEAPARTARSAAGATASAAADDTLLTSYLAWNRDMMLLANRHRAEIEAESQRIAGGQTFIPPDTFARDPGLRALLDRQREESARFMSRAPQGPTVRALDATLPGVGQMVIGPTSVTYVPGRNEAVLAAARATYGDEFVRWVLAHERTIVATLSAVR